MKSRAQEKIDRYKIYLSMRTNFESYWQSLHDYFYVESPDTSSQYYPGTELNVAKLFDTTPLEAADVLASGFMNYLTPPTSKWFNLKHRNPKLAENKAVKDFLDDVEREVNLTINRSNFYSQAFSSYKSSGVYGTSILLEEEDLLDEARFYNLPINQVVIVEDANGRPSEFFIEFEYTADQAAERWGKDKLSRELQEEVGKNIPPKKHKILLVIGKRSIRDVRKSNKENLPIEALWLEMEKAHTIEESGYHEFPAMAHRFDKRPFIVWGFSPGMKALSAARMLNAIAKTNLRTMMKHTDPPVAVPHNAFIAPFDANPRQVNYYKKDIMTGGGKDIFAFGNFGDPKTGLAAVEYYSQKVRSLMYNDVFLAFNQLTKQMNNPEIAERVNEKMMMLGPAVGRYLSEVLNPIIERTIGILARRGKLPNPPDEIILDPNYDIDFIGKLAQAQKMTELQGLVTGLNLVGEMAKFTPEVLDKVDSDKVTDEVWDITGAPVRVLRDDAEIEKIREMRAQEIAKQQELALMGAGADIAQKGSQAEVNLAKAKEGTK